MPMHKIRRLTSPGRRPFAVPGMDNLRDVALAHPSLRCGVLYRGGDLHGLTLQAARRLEGLLKIETIVDLRTDGEREREPDTALPGAAVFVAPMHYGKSAGGLGLYARIAAHALAEKAEAVIGEAYRAMAKEHWPMVLAALTSIAEAKGPVLLHCRNGKDRTGFVTALLLEALCVPEEDFVSDYLMSNLYLANKNVRDFQKMSEGMDQRQKRQLWAMFEVREAYLRAALSASKPLPASLVARLREKLTK